MILPAGYLQTRGSQIVSADGTPVRLAGVNWYGFDCTDMVVGGLKHQTLDAICQGIVDLGFNSIRLPYSVQAVLENPVITSNLDREPALQGQRVLDIMDAVITTARAHGLKVILDCHRSEAGWSTQRNGLWYTQAYPESAWLQAWEVLVRRYSDDSTVIGCDLRNEPGAPALDANAWPRNGGALWGYGDGFWTRQPRDWAAAAERAGNTILSINPNLLIFVEGVRYDPAGPHLNGRHELYWPGGNLTGVKRAAPPYRWRARPITLREPNRLVYSAHDYGPDLYRGLAWCQHGATAETQNACRSVWDQTWGFIIRKGIAPIWLGEFGTPNGYKPGDRTACEYYVRPNSVNPQGTWFTYLVQYIAELGISWCYWCLNGTQSAALSRDPKQPDWYGVFTPAWNDVASQPMMELLHTIQDDDKQGR